MPKKDRTGHKYGYLTALRPLYRYKNGTTIEWVWEVKCVCGKIIKKRGGQLTAGDSKSCGCMSNKMKSITKMKEKNPMWKGDFVGYTGLHKWVKSRLPKPKFCQECKEKEPIDLANKGIYDRNLKNWEWLCRKCHMTKDGRIKNLKNQGG